jgi:diaminohydroxyphosphoribosylaminopyrimidine deaminase/5-amino-6-(5-phosphoribosylamino)uracil reductase
LAANGLGKTYPNPLVGSVVVYENQIIGEGWHQKAGTPHAEVHAINSVKQSELLQKSTIYVNLEPCAHFGKTPPCCDLILHHQIPHVVIANVDPFDAVAGKSIKKLKASGKQVEVGVLEKEGKWLNRRFFTFHQQKRPWIILKWAQTDDGFIAPEIQENKTPFWISNEFSQQRVHQWRSEEMAILVGTQTVLKDNPSLTTRYWKGNSPIRLVIDLHHEIPVKNPIFSEEAPTFVFTYTINKHLPERVNQLIINQKQAFWAQVMDYLYQCNIQSLVVEGGAFTLQSLVNQGLWDEARIFTAPKTLQKGVKAPILKDNKMIFQEKIIHDLYTQYLHLKHEANYF